METAITILGIAIVIFISAAAISVVVIITGSAYYIAARFLRKGMAILIAAIAGLASIAVIAVAVESVTQSADEVFEDVVGISMPKSANVVRYASGCYSFDDICYGYLIEFSPEDYSSLMEYVKGSELFDDRNIIWGETLQEILGDIEYTAVIYVASYYEKRDCKSIGFVNDMRSVIIYIVHE